MRSAAAAAWLGAAGGSFDGAAMEPSRPFRLPGPGPALAPPGRLRGLPGRAQRLPQPVPPEPRPSLAPLSTLLCGLGLGERPCPSLEAGDWPLGGCLCPGRPRPGLPRSRLPCSLLPAGRGTAGVVEALARPCLAVEEEEGAAAAPPCRR